VQTEGIPAKNAQRKTLKKYIDILSTKIERQTILYRHRNAQFTERSKRRLSRHIDSGQSNSKKENKSRSKSRNKSRNLDKTIRQILYPLLLQIKIAILI
jgi:hypothetical protein